MRIFAFITFLFLGLNISAQEKEIDLYSLSLEDLINIEVSISTKTKINLRENPGIVTVITKDEIKRSGARDIIELFHLFVPGFDFGVDVEGVVGMGIRGIWAHEGKYLFMVNGFEMNDGMFSCVPFGNHFALDNVERIEIIRGPGSAVYGGFAGLGVVNIITRSGFEQGGKITYTATHTGKQFSMNQISFGQTVTGEDVTFNIASTYGAGSRSDRNYFDYYQNTRNLTRASDIYNKQLSLQLTYKNFTAQTLLDEYSFEQIDLWDQLYPGPPLQESFRSNFGEFSYKFHKSNLTIIPKINYKWQKPWRLNVPDMEYTNNKVFNKLSPSVNAIYGIKNLQITGGIEYNYDNLKQPKTISYQFEEPFKNGKNYLDYQNFGAYTQILWNSKYANISVGARYDNSTKYGDAFVPRIGITKAFKKFHFKIMGNKSFRVPGGIMPNRVPEGFKKLKPEYGTIYEFETGYILAPYSTIVLNVYDITFKDLIIYGKEPQTGVGYYKNQGHVGTAGIEVGFKINTDKLFSTINFAYYRRKSSNSDSLFMVPTDNNQYLALSPVRINSLIGYRVSRNSTVSITTSYFGERYSYNYLNNNKDILVKHKANLLVGLNLEFMNFPFKKFETQVIATNLLNSDFYYLQPYKGAHGPLPGLDRSFGFRVIYEY